MRTALSCILVALALSAFAGAAVAVASSADFLCVSEEGDENSVHFSIFPDEKKVVLSGIQYPAQIGNQTVSFEGTSSLSAGGTGPYLYGTYDRYTKRLRFYHTAGANKNNSWSESSYTGDCSRVPDAARP